MKLQNSSDDLSLNQEINVTPFIDVMLVLLIIFMIAAPLTTVNVPVDLPVSTATAQPDLKDPLVVSLDVNRAVTIGEDPVDMAALGQQLVERTQGDRSTRIFLQADEAVPYRDIMELMNALRAVGFLKVSLVGLDKGAATS